MYTIYMDKEQKIAEQVKVIADLAKDNSNIDVASLMLNALKTDNRKLVEPKYKRWAYLISAGAPPAGIIFAFRYYFGEEEDGKQVAYTCIVLTILGSIGALLFLKGLFGSSGASVDQIKTIKPSDIKSLYE